MLESSTFIDEVTRCRTSVCSSPVRPRFAPRTSPPSRKPQIGHRGDEFKGLYTRVVSKLQQLLETKDPVFLFTCSSTGVWEAAIRNSVQRARPVLHAGRVFRPLAQGRGDEREGSRPAEGRVGARDHRADDRRRARQGSFDAITVVHNETSTGVMNRMDEIAARAAEVPRRHLPRRRRVVDGRRADPGGRVAHRRLPRGLQKAFALPAGLTVASVSSRALDKAKTVKNRGYYFDFLDMLKYHERGQTPATPAIPQIQALDAQLDDILAETPKARFERHDALARDRPRAGRGAHFALFAEEGYESPTLDLHRQHARDLGRRRSTRSSASSGPRSRTATATSRRRRFASPTWATRRSGRSEAFSP